MIERCLLLLSSIVEIIRNNLMTISETWPKYYVITISLGKCYLLMRNDLHTFEIMKYEYERKFLCVYTTISI